MTTDPSPGSREAPRTTGRRPLRTGLLFLGALLFLFEEYLWNLLTRFFAWLGRFGVMRWLDAKLVRLPPAAALVILCVPMVLLFPVKIVGLWMIGSGRFVGGCLVMLGAKVLGTAVVARIFLTCKPQLLQMPWFARLHAWTGVLRERVHRWLAEQPAWHQAKRAVRRTKARLRALTGRVNDDGVTRPGTLRRWRALRKARRRAGFTAARGSGSGPNPP